MIILDSDPGIDDACAIILAKRYFGEKFRAVTTVAGNVSVEKTTINALRLKETLGLKLKVYRGASRPLIRRYVDAAHVHGSDGLGDSGLPLPKSKEENISAAEAIIRLAKRKNLSIIATGPLTNIALALIIEPRLPEMIKEITVMGGAFRLNEYGKGNETEYSEFNFYEDPEAARIVFENFKNINVVPLDLTMNPSLWFESSEVERFPETKEASFIKLITKNYLKNNNWLVLHDAIAVDVHKNRDEYRFVEGMVKVVTYGGKMRGASFLDRSNKYNHRVYVEPIGKGFKERFLESIS